MTAPGGPVYPMPRRAGDHRFTVEMVREVARVLEEHGYRDVADVDEHLTGLQLALFRFLYGSAWERLFAELLVERYPDAPVRDRGPYVEPLMEGNSGPGGPIADDPAPPAGDPAGWLYTRDDDEGYESPPLLVGVAGYPMGRR